MGHGQRLWFTLAFRDAVKIVIQDWVKMLLTILVSPGIVASLLAVSVLLDLDAAILVNASAFVFIIVLSLFMTPYFTE